MADDNSDWIGVSRWAWIMGIIVVIILAVGLFALINDYPDPEPDIEVVDAALDYSQWVERDMPEYELERSHVMAGEGFEHLARALDGVIDATEGLLVPPPPPADPVDVSPLQDEDYRERIREMFEIQLERIRANANRLVDSEDSLQHGDYARDAAAMAMDVMHQLQEQYYTGAAEAVQEAQAAAARINPGVMIQDQRQIVTEFFRRVDDVFQAKGMYREPADPIDPPDPPVEPSPDAPGAEPGLPPPAPPPGT